MRNFKPFRPLVAAVAVAGLLATACGDEPLGTVDAFLDEFPSAILNPWLVCDLVETPAQISRAVTGGESTTLTLPRGHRLEIPATALPPGETVQITFRQLATAAVAVELLPSPLELTDSVTLTLAFEGRGCGVENPAELAIYRARLLPPHELLPSAPGPEGTVVGRMDHFTSFAIAQ